MAKPRLPKKVLDSYTIRGTNKIIKAGDCVLMKPSDSSKLPYVAKVEKIEANGRGGNVQVHVRWYYRPEESMGGRRQFHGVKEVFLSDHYDVQSADTIEGKCTVHTFKSYTKLEAVGNEDYFCRFEYKSSTGGFNPDRVAVYCKCEMPYNPDDLMVQCEGCHDWFHPHCINMTAEEAKRLEHFFCQTCSPHDEKKTQNSHKSSRHSEIKNYSQIACWQGPQAPLDTGGYKTQTKVIRCCNRNIFSCLVILGSLKQHDLRGRRKPRRNKNQRAAASTGLCKFLCRVCTVCLCGTVSFSLLGPGLFLGL